MSDWALRRTRVFQIRSLEDTNLSGDDSREQKLNLKLFLENTNLKVIGREG